MASAATSTGGFTTPEPAARPKEDMAYQNPFNQTMGMAVPYSKSLSTYQSTTKIGDTTKTIFHAGESEVVESLFETDWERGEKTADNKYEERDEKTTKDDHSMLQL